MSLARAIRPERVADLQDLVRGATHLRISGLGTKESFRLPVEAAQEVTLAGLSGVVDFSPDDQVATVRAGTSLGELQEALREKQQCIPISPLTDALDGTVGGCLSMNLPHFLEAEAGSWRDWVLGLKVVLADGTVANAGSKVVKNVAGYDVQKLFIGARGTLGIVVEVTLRTSPLRSLSKPRLLRNRVDAAAPESLWIQRVLATDFPVAWAQASAWNAVGAASPSTLVVSLPNDQVLPRFSGDWVLRSGCAAQNLQFRDETHIRLMKRAKQIFDPEGKLNPGEMGVL